MTSSIPSQQLERDGLDELAVTLVQQASWLARLVFARLDVDVSRSEASLLARLEAGPQRITSLAELDGLAQPTVTLLVKHLESEALVRRERSFEDGRVVIVSLTTDGRDALELVRRHYRERLRSCLADLPRKDIAALQQAIGPMTALLGRLQTEAWR